MRVVTADEVDRALDFPSLIEALARAFAGGITSPERQHHAIGAGDPHPVHLLMPAWSDTVPGEGSYLGTKLVNVFPENGARGLPAVNGTYVLFSGETGIPLAAIDGTRLTLWRTAAASGLAARFLARPDAGHLLMVGAGALAPFLIRAHAAVRPLERVSIWSRRPEAAESLAATCADLGLEVAAVADLRSAAERADVISCATLSRSPLIEGAWLRPGAHLDLVGAYAMGMQEADEEALRRARVFVDTPKALTEGGDVAVAIAAGRFAAEDVVATLHDLVSGAKPGRRAGDEITLFKSVGAALEDLAGAMMVWSQVQSAG